MPVIDLGGVRLHYADSGGRGPAVLLLAGVGSRGRTCIRSRARGRRHADVDRLPAYAKLAVPCLVVGFADDLIAPAAGCRDVAAVIPGARYAEIPDAGRYGYLEQPARLNAALIDFLEDK